MIYDVKTKNYSFLRVAQYLRKKGIKNNKFMLILYDEGLSGVDPYSDAVANNAELQFRIYREICRNSCYYLREIVRVPADGRDIPYESNIANITMAYLKERNMNVVEILPRQHGKTMSNVVWDSWPLLFITKNANYVYLNKGKNDAVKNLKIFKDIKERLPEWLRKNFVEDAKRDIDNQENKLIALRNNTLKVVSPGTDEDHADKQGRGLTVSNIYWDEFSFTKYCDITYQACIPAWKKAAENAKKSGTPYGFIITTTPANLDTEPGMFCYNIIGKSAKWKLELFDFTNEQLDEYLRSNSENNFMFVQYTYKELGRDEAWLKEMIRDCQGDLAKVKREILLEWPKSMESSVFNEDQLEKIYQFVKQPVSRIFVDGKYPIEFYEMPDLNKNYIISCDVAGGLSRDNSAINIIDPEDFRVVGDFVNNRIDTDSFKKLIIQLMTLYMRNALLVIEKNSYGLNIIQSLMKDAAIEPRMYREEKETLGEKKQSNGFTVKKKTKTISYGVDTNAQTRKQMFDLLPEIVETEYDKFVSPNIYRDISNLEKKKTGKIEHSSSGHDDSIMAYLIFRFAVFYGKCFRDRFGISPVPSRMNVKTISSDEGFRRIEGVILRANADTESNMVLNSDLYKSLVDKTQKMESADTQLSSFMKIANLNK